MVIDIRQFRLAINTLRKIGGAAHSDLVELDSLPVEDSEVVCRYYLCGPMLVVVPDKVVVKNVVG
jgi:hypothetical protein